MMRWVAGVFSYSKTKGLFAGVFLERSAINAPTDTTTWPGQVVEAIATAKGNQETLGMTFTAPNEQVPSIRLLHSSPLKQINLKIWDSRRETLLR
jgi:hypothetical protein